MVLFPYKADVELSRWPTITMAVCAICIWVFVRQEISEHAYRSSLMDYCNHEITRDDRLVMHYLGGPQGRHICDVMLEIRAAPNRAAAIRGLSEHARQVPFYRNPADSTDYIANALTESSRRFERAVPPNLTERLQYDPNGLNVWRMVTAAFSHADWWHLTSNLVFFFAFAASVEVIAGHGYFFGFILLSAIGTHLAYRYSVSGAADALPTIGLSGVVMATMAFLATVIPALRIRCVFWLFVIVRMFRVPALAIAALYIVENIFGFVNRDADSTVNYIAHISGAAIGVAMGTLYRLTHRDFLRGLVQDI